MVTLLISNFRVIKMIYFSINAALQIEIVLNRIILFKTVVLFPGGNFCKKYNVLCLVYIDFFVLIESVQVFECD